MKLFTFTPFFLAFVVGALSYKFNYPPGKTMESIVHFRGSLFLMSDYVTGNVMMVDTRSRQTFTIVQAPANRTIQGIEVMKKKQLVVACGGGAFLNKFIQERMEGESPNVLNVVFPQVPTGIHIYNISTGLPYASCMVDNAQVINDVVFDRAEKYAYISDTRSSMMYRLDLKALPACRIKYIQLPKDTFEGSLFQGAGLAYYKTKRAEGVIIANFSPKTFHFYDVKTEETYTMGDSISGVDGLRLVRNRCLVGALNTPAVKYYRVRYNPVTKRLQSTYVRDQPDPDNELVYPTTLSIVGKNMVVGNQNTTTLGITGQLFGSVVRIPSVEKLC